MPRTSKNTRRTSPGPPALPVPGIADDRLLGDVRSLIEAAREQTARAVNAALFGLYWNIGTRIREDVLKHKRAGYGAEIVSALARELTKLGHPLLTRPGTAGVIKESASLYTETRGLFPSLDLPRNHHGLTRILEQRADRGQADRTASDR